MSLWIPPTYFADSAEWSGAASNPGASEGVAVTASGSTNTKGSYVTLVGAVNYDAHWLTIYICNTNATGTRTDSLLDIAIGDAGGGNERIILPNLLAGWVNDQRNGGRVITLPMLVPAGKDLRARAQSVTSSKVVRVHAWLEEGISGGGWHTFTGADAYGVTSAAASNGTNVTSGNSGAEGSWTSIGSTTSRDYDGLLFMVQGSTSDTTMTSTEYHFEVGWSSTMIREYLVGTNSNEFLVGPNPPIPIFRPVPSGTQLQVRGEATATAEILDCALYGLY